MRRRRSWRAADAAHFQHADVQLQLQIAFSAQFLILIKGEELQDRSLTVSICSDRSGTAADLQRGVGSDVHV